MNRPDDQRCKQCKWWDDQETQHVECTVEGEIGLCRWDVPTFSAIAYPRSHYGETNGVWVPALATDWCKEFDAA